MAKVEGVGRVLRASIDLMPGDVVFKELPVVVGHVHICHNHKMHLVVYNPKGIKVDFRWVQAEPQVQSALGAACPSVGRSDVTDVNGR